MLSGNFSWKRELLKQFLGNMSRSELHGSHGYDQIVVEKFHSLVSLVYSEFRCSCSDYWPDIMEMKCRNETSLWYQCFAISHYPISYS